ncbi:hypothetical protein [Piscirickettsia litoralis]|uniref:Uncharacterized protein n=1 Tax=Piscirickettsia litoralis TaxID=1891921 RepID=A0ABX2ZWQ5_9GAMM|nr:hypothetical protein [Piscirickettsia litoralis]ODN41021.1 hypothetical protein BGC07_18490 [Piscirickettsia litoralis]
MKAMKLFISDLEQGTRFLLVTVILFYACTLAVYLVQWSLSYFTDDVSADLGSALITSYFLIVLSIFVGTFFKKLRDSND